MHQATDILRREHDTILKMLGVAERVADRLDQDKKVLGETLDDLIEFFTLFADKCHHGKEEDLLFPLMEGKGIPRDGGPIGVMLHEHDMGRAFVRQMRELAARYARGDASVGRSWAQAARGYTALLRQHIQKENEILFVMAENALTDDEQVELAGEFEKVEPIKDSTCSPDRLDDTLERLEKQVPAS